jgi:hypothetical protein
MAKFGVFLTIISSIAISILVSSQAKTPCESPLLYRIGSHDERFGISEIAFRDAIEQAASLWERALGFELFAYDPTAAFAINLVFDERQQATIDKQQLTRTLEQMASSQSNITQSYAHWQETYKAKKTAYDSLLTAYQARVAAHNREVKRWNTSGGAPPQIYDALSKERQALAQLEAQLGQDRAYINDVIDMLTSMQQQSHTIADTYKTEVSTYHARYGEHARFNQGEYNGKAITIYQFNERADLILVLAHELGHALRLGHVDDPTAIMHYLMGEQDLDGLSLTPDDINALKVVCHLD